MPRLLPLAGGAALLAGGAASALALHPVFGARPSGKRLARVQASPNYQRGAFRNALPEAPLAPSAKMLRDWLLSPSDGREPSAPIPTQPREGSDFAGPAPDLRITWLGHATTLVEIEGRRFLTDPVWSDRASPGKLFGVERFFAPPLALDALPPLDGVLVSHDHYDHLDHATVRALAPRVPRWLAPLGVGAHLERWGVEPGRITEVDWWDETEVDGIRLALTPTRHFSGRLPWGRGQTLWGGWALIGAERRVWFSGDGGMGPHFAEVGRRLGPFDVSLVEVGAYDARWSDVHMGPEQAVRAHLAARGGLLVPVHWGTFNLAFHGWTEPAERVLVAAQGAGVPLALPRPGQSVVPGEAAAWERWWPAQPWQTADQAPVVSSGL